GPRNRGQQGFLTLRGGELPREQGGTEASRKIRAKSFDDGAEMLLGENFRRREERRLAAGLRDGEHRTERHKRLTGTHLPLNETVHRGLCREIRGDLLPHRALIAREGERKNRI